MRKFLLRHFGLKLLCPFAAAVPLGCALPQTHQSVGWDIHVGRPATVLVPATVQQTEGPLVVGGVAAMPTGGAVRGGFVVPQGECSQGPVTAQLAGGVCSLADVCASLNRIETKLSGAPGTMRPAEALPMPKGPPQE